MRNKNDALNEKNKMLVQKIKEGHSEYISDLITNNKGIVHKCALRTGRKDLLDDLLQEGNLGIMIAINKFDMDKEVKFVTYATWWINQKIRRYIENNSRNIRLPVYLQEIIKQEKVKCVSQIPEVAARRNVNPRNLEKAFMIMNMKERKEEMEKALENATEINLWEREFPAKLSDFFKNELQEAVFFGKSGLFGNEFKTNEEIEKETGIPCNYIDRAFDSILGDMRKDESLCFIYDFFKCFADEEEREIYCSVKGICSRKQLNKTEVLEKYGLLEESLEYLIVKVEKKIKKFL